MNRWFCKIIRNSENKYYAVMEIEGKQVQGLAENVDYRTLSKSIEDKTGIRILKCKSMIFEKLSNTEKVATIDCTQSRDGDCRVTMEELLNGWKPAWKEQNIEDTKEESNITISNEATKLHSLFKENYRDPKYCHRDKFISGLAYSFIKKNGFDDNAITELLNNNIIEQYDNDGYRMTKEAIKDFMTHKSESNEIKEETLKNEQNKINENKITINFANIVSELETRNLKLCFRKNKVGMFIIDSQNNMYNIELYRSGSYLDQLIKDGIIVEFNYIDASLSKNIGEWEKEIWDVAKVEDFIKRQKL